MAEDIIHTKRWVSQPAFRQSDMLVSVKSMGGGDLLQHRLGLNPSYTRRSWGWSLIFWWRVSGFYAQCHTTLAAGRPQNAHVWSNLAYNQDSPAFNGWISTWMLHFWTAEWTTCIQPHGWQPPLPVGKANLAASLHVEPITIKDKCKHCGWS